MALGWLREHGLLDIVRDRLISWIVHICLHQFRSDILYKIKADLRVHQRVDALKAKRPFCMDYFREVFTQKVYLISGNWSEVKAAPSLAHFLFDFDNGLVRTH